MALPSLVEHYVARATSEHSETPQRVRFGQVGEMRQKPDGRPLRFVAEEEFAVDEIAFRWRARFPILSLVSLEVLDRYEAGEGSLEGRLFGKLRLFREAGPEVDEAEALRYLAELPWAPHAISANPQLEWRELGGDTVEVSARLGSRRPAMRFKFGAGGDIVGVSCDSRPRVVGKRIEPTAWSGSFGGYELVAGIRIPAYGEVRWELPDGPFTYWRGTITAYEIVS